MVMFTTTHLHFYAARAGILKMTSDETCVVRYVEDGEEHTSPEYEMYLGTDIFWDAFAVLC